MFKREVTTTKRCWEGRMGLYAIATAPPESKKKMNTHGDDVKRKENGDDDVKTKGD